ncbi:hypothetical protein FACS189449_05820 [Alphaproteobacteria bacterium]|nr:hypothetical protein FACS189449_05820 [Alphaproteobacteria bacterium]
MLSLVLLVITKNNDATINKNRNGVAYTIIDTNSKADAALKDIESVKDVISVRVISRS